MQEPSALVLAAESKKKTMNIALAERIRSLSEQLCERLYERDEVMKLALLAAVAGESIFLLGPPGVGKSLIARRLKFAFRDAKSFEYLMTRFSTPDEVFGPVSIRKLKDEDRYERLTEHYMPDASVVFLDEIWKAGSSIQNSLLTIINERVYRNGQQELPVAIRALITASNELPSDGESHGPLWDRLLLRYPLEGIRSERNFQSMISDVDGMYDDPVEDELKITQEELKAWDQAINEVKLPEEVMAALQLIRQRIEAGNKKQDRRPLLIYDRRWKKTVRILRASAFLNGRSEVDLMDLFLVLHCLWDEPAQIEWLRELVVRSIREHGYSLALPLSRFTSALEDFTEEVNKEVYLLDVDEEEVLTPEDDQWYRLEQSQTPFEGSRLRIDDFNRLPMHEDKVLNLYDDQGKLVNRLAAKKDAQAFSLQIEHNSQRITYRLVTHKRERKRRIRRKAHPLLIRHWNERYQDLHKDLTGALKALDEKRPEHWSQLEKHLFTDHRLAPFVKANMEEVKEVLEKCRLRLEKLRFEYEEGHATE